MTELDREKTVELGGMNQQDTSLFINYFFNIQELI